MAINALFTGTSGLQANSAWLDAIGNNLANQNTTGYKGQVVQFSDLLYQTISAGSGPTATTGGINPIQVGVGVQIGGVGSNFTQGNLTRTGRDLDFGIQGNGFFVLKNGVTTVYSRSGAFDVDSAGYLVDPTSGYRVQRFGSVGEGSLGVPGFQTPGTQDLRMRRAGNAGRRKGCLLARPVLAGLHRIGRGRWRKHLPIGAARIQRTGWTVVVHPFPRADQFAKRQPERSAQHVGNHRPRNHRRPRPTHRHRHPHRRNRGPGESA